MTDAHPLDAFTGSWRGRGRGEYPTIESFEYTEQFTITPVPGRPVAHWRSITRDAASGEPRHAESGFLRATPSGLELVVAHSFGIVESTVGGFDGELLELRSTGLIGTPSAKQVDEVERRYEFGPAMLRYDIAMAAVGIGLTHHLACELRRT